MNKIKGLLQNLGRKIFIFRLFSVALRAKKSKRNKLAEIDVYNAEMNRYKNYYGKTPDLENPKLFSEKILSVTLLAEY